MIHRVALKSIGCRAALPAGGLRHLILLLACVAFLLLLLPAPDAAAFAFPARDFDEPIGSGLVISPPRPAGVNIETASDSLTVSYNVPDTRRGEAVSLILVLPPSALLPGVLVGPDSEKQLFMAEELGIMRFYRLVRLTLHPRDNEVGEPIGAITVRFPFSAPVEATGIQEPFSLAERGFLQILDRLVANPEHLAIYADRAQGTPNTPPLLSHPWDIPEEDDSAWFQVTIEEDGLYRITDEHFRQVGLDPLSIDPSVLEIVSRGESVPVFLLTDGEDGFTSGTSLVFHGQASDSEYSTGRAYWVHIPSSGERQVSRIPVRPAAGMPASDVQAVISTERTEVFEEDLDHQMQHGAFLTIRNSAWVWREIDGQNATVFGFDLPLLDPNRAKPVELVITCFLKPGESFTDLPPLGIWLNGEPVGEPVAIDQTKTPEWTYLLDPGLLREMGNALEFRFTAPLPENRLRSGVFLDRFSVRANRYLVARDGRVEIETPGVRPWHKMVGFGGRLPLIFDLTDPDSPWFLTSQTGEENTVFFHESQPDRRLVAVLPESIPPAPPALARKETGILRSGNEEDYVLIYHSMFRDSVEQLASYHGLQGLRVRTVDVDEIFQKFSHGETTPHAIKDFLAFMLRTWQTPATFICLFGDASADYRNELKSGEESFVPSFSHVTMRREKWASDHWYATVAGESLLPDYLLGRISVRNREDAAEVVRKAIDYAQIPPMGPWRSEMIFCSDDGLFRPAVEEIAHRYRPAAVGSTRIFVDEFPWEDEFYLPREVVKAMNIKVSTDTTLKILDSIDRGAAMVMFFGHGSPNIWTDERIWFGGGTQRSDNLNLRNQGRLPLVSTFSCNQGAFDYPMPPWSINISEDMMRVPDGGAIAMFVPSGPGTTPQHEGMAQGLMRAVYADGLRGLGEVTTMARMRALLRGTDESMIRMYVLLGDPALKMPLPGNTVEGVVRPSVVDRAKLHENVLVFEAQAEDLTRGMFTATLYDPKDREFFRSGKTSFRQGLIRFPISLPPSPEPGEWTVRVYYGDEASGDDGVAWARFRIVSPHIKVGSLNFRTAPSGPGESVELYTVVVNESDVPAKGAVFRLRITNAWGDVREIVNPPVDFAPGERRELDFAWSSESGLHGFEMEALRYTFPLSDSELRQESKRLEYVVPGLPGPGVWTIPALGSARYAGGHPGDRFVWTQRVFCEGYPEGTSWIASLESASGDLLATSTMTVGTPDADGYQSVSFDLPFDRSIAGPFNFALRPVSDSAEESVHESPLSIRLPAHANLRILSHSVQFRPEVLVEGTTVFARMVVENQGDALSGSFLVRPSEILEGGRIAALSSSAEANMQQRPLAPGRHRAITIRWDYPPYEEIAGEHTIHLSLLRSGQSIQRTDVMGSPTTSSLRILSRPMVEMSDMFSAIHPLGGDLSRAMVHARIRNLGEAPGSGYRIGFYRRPPLKPEDHVDPDFLHLQKNLPEIPGLGEIMESLEWDLRDMDEDTSPTARVFRLTKTIRTRTDEEAENRDW